MTTKIDDLLAKGGMPEVLEGMNLVEELGRVATVAAGSAQVSDGPDETKVHVEPWPDPIHKAAFHGLAGRLVRVIEPYTEADSVALLVQLLVAFGSVIGRSAYLLAENDRHYCNLFAVIVGRSSKARKGTSWGRIKQLFASFIDWMSDRVKTGLSSGEGLIWQVRDRLVEEKWNEGKKGEPGFSEEVVVDAGVADKRLLVEEPEFASVLKVTSREGNTLSPTIRSAWDTGALSTLTKNSTNRATGAHISIIGHITNVELKRTLRETEAGNGFGNRFLWVCSKRSKILPESRPVPADILAPLVAELHEAISWAQNRGEMSRDEEAREDWIRVYPELSGDRHGLAGALTTRAEAQVSRLSLVYALLDQSPVIRREHLEAALALWDFCEQSARFIFGESLGDPVADEIRRLLESKPDGATRTEITQHFGGHKSRKELDAALKTLLELDLVDRRKTGDTGGRPKETWFLKKETANKAESAKKGPESQSVYAGGCE